MNYVISHCEQNPLTTRVVLTSDFKRKKAGDVLCGLCVTLYHHDGKGSKTLRRTPKRWYASAVWFEGQQYNLMEHQIVFFMHHGYVPAVIDHDDQNPLNNDITNLVDQHNDLDPNTIISVDSMNSMKKESVYADLVTCVGFNGTSWGYRIADYTLGLRSDGARARPRAKHGFATYEEANRACIEAIRALRPKCTWPPSVVLAIADGFKKPHREYRIAATPPGGYAGIPHPAITG